jgi:hypothetical protein
VCKILSPTHWISVSPYLPPLSTPYLPPDDHGAEGGPCQPGTRSRGNSVLAQSRQCSSPHAGPPRASPAPRRSGHRVLKRQYDNAGVTRFGRTGPGIEGTDGVIISRTTHMCGRRMVITPSRSFNARHQVVPSICPLMSTEERACGSNRLLPERCNRPRIAPFDTCHIRKEPSRNGLAGV